MITAADILHARILIVDDKEANVTLLHRILLSAGYGTFGTVTSTTIPDEVRDLHLRNRYDLILLDLEMPGMDGFQVMQRLKQLGSDACLPVLVITAQPCHKLRALEAGARDFIGKPFEVAEVLLRVHNALEVRLLHLEAVRVTERMLTERERFPQGTDCPRPRAD
jgi:adenylate cyclase